MATVTKKELIDKIADATGQKRVVVKRIVQTFLNSITVELGKGNRLEFRDFGVFEVKHRRARKAQNPKTLDPVHVPPKRTVKFKVGRLMKQTLTDDGVSADLDFDLDSDGSEEGADEEHVEVLIPQSAPRKRLGTTGQKHATSDGG